MTTKEMTLDQQRKSDQLRARGKTLAKSEQWTELEKLQKELKESDAKMMKMASESGMSLSKGGRLM